jgi:iron complex transport system permease protein
MSEPVKRKIFWILLAVVTVASLTLSPLVGIKFTSISAVFTPDSANVESQIFWTLRLPRVLTAFFAGSALAMSGLVFQTLFRNPLATESTLGATSGASFGAAVFSRIAPTLPVMATGGTFLFAFTGAMLSMTMVYGVVRFKRQASMTVMLLAGVAVSFFFSSLILLVQSTADFYNSYKLLRWLMGGLASSSYRDVLMLTPGVIIITATIFYYRRELDLWLAGEDIAVSRGVETRRLRTILFILTSLVVGVVVSVCGPIGFVGLVAPHIARRLSGEAHRWLLGSSALLGGTFLILADTIARSITAPAELPVGAITALLGGPFFLWILAGNNAERGRSSHE